MTPTRKTWTTTIYWLIPCITISYLSRNEAAVMSGVPAKQLIGRCERAHAGTMDGYVNYSLACSAVLRKGLHMSPHSTMIDSSHPGLPHVFGSDAHSWPCSMLRLRNLTKIQQKAKTKSLPPAPGAGGNINKNYVCRTHLLTIVVKITTRGRW